MDAGNSSSPYFNLTLPNESLTYDVRVAAVNTQGLGAAQSDVLPVCLGMNREGGQYMIIAQCLIIMSYWGLFCNVISVHLNYSK